MKGGVSGNIDTKPVSFDLRGLQHSAGFDLGKAIKENTPLDGPKADAAKIGDAIKQNTPLDGPKADAQKVATAFESRALRAHLTLLWKADIS